MLVISGTGRLGKAPKMQYDPKGGAVTKFSVATDVGFGEYKKTVWTSLVAFGKQAEILNEYLDKGSLLAFTAEVTDNRGYSKGNEEVGVSLDAKVLTFTFLSKGKATNNEPEEF